MKVRILILLILSICFTINSNSKEIDKKANERLIILHTGATYSTLDGKSFNKVDNYYEPRYFEYIDATNIIIRYESNNNGKSWHKVNSYNNKEVIINEFSDKINIYPNPIKSNFKIDFKASKVEFMKITITDINGKEYSLFEGKSLIGNNIINLNSDGLRAGTYILKIQTTNKLRTQKLIVNK